jgi:hypothetical protein
LSTDDWLQPATVRILSEVSTIRVGSR